MSRLFLQDVAGGGVGGGGGRGVGTTWPDTVKQTGAGGTLTPADRHGSVQVSEPALSYFQFFYPLIPLFHLYILNSKEKK